MLALDFSDKADDKIRQMVQVMVFGSLLVIRGVEHQ